MCRTKNKPTTSYTLTNIIKFVNIQTLTKLLISPEYIHVACWCIILGEIALNIAIIEYVQYTEIDWIAYMQEVGGFLNGTWDYSALRGDTGPLVYPAGFVYIYSVLFYVTSDGSNIYLAQYVFLVLYIGQLYLSFRLLIRTSKVPPYALILATAASYRIHSIYVLRLFNDPIAVLLFYASLNALLGDRWGLCSVLFSLAVSVKMNVLLYAPALLIAYLTNLSKGGVLFQLIICATIQVALALPFLYCNHVAYITGSFNLGRIFDHRWTVNFRFLPVEWFEHRALHLGLLGLHVGLLLLFAPHMWRYLRSYRTLRTVLTDIKADTSRSSKGEGERSKRKQKKQTPKHSYTKSDKQEQKEEKLSKHEETFLSGYELMLKQQNSNSKQRRIAATPAPLPSSTKEITTIQFGKIAQLAILPFYVSNLIGIACARSLHYQFYSWYYHSLLYLVHSTPFSKTTVFLILGTIEYCWNVYPSTDLSSVLLHVSHICLLYGVYKTMTQ